jgi:hypothetical protein
VDLDKNVCEFEKLHPIWVQEIILAAFRVADDQARFRRLVDRRIQCARITQSADLDSLWKLVFVDCFLQQISSAETGFKSDNLGLR